MALPISPLLPFSRWVGGDCRNHWQWHLVWSGLTLLITDGLLGGNDGEKFREELQGMMVSLLHSLDKQLGQIHKSFSFKLVHLLKDTQLNFSSTLTLLVSPTHLEQQSSFNVPCYLSLQPSVQGSDARFKNNLPL